MPRRIPRRSDRIQPAARNVLDARRASTANVVYDHAWQRVAKQRRREDGYLCQLCLAEERLTPSSDVDHIIPIHVRPDWRLEFDNTQVICRPHHAKKTIADARRYGSSTTQVLTAMQRAARQAAAQLTQLPREGRGGPVKPPDAIAKIVSPPARIPPRNWAPGGPA